MDNITNPIQVQKYLGGIHYPVKRDELIKRAEEAGADQNILQTLSKIKGDVFNSPADVSKAIGELL